MAQLDRIERLHTRGNSPNFHYQRKVPARLVEIIGKRHWREALKTADRALAIRKRDALNVVTDAEIEAADDAIERVARAEGKLKAADPALVEAVRKAGGIEKYETAIRTLVEGRSIHAIGIAIAEIHGPDPAGPDLAYDDPSMDVERASDQAVQAALGRAVARGATGLKSLGLDTTDDIRAVVSEVQPGMIETFERWMEREGKNPDTRDMRAQRHNIEEFVGLIGNKPVDSITIDDAEGYRGALSRLPNIHPRKPEYALTPREKPGESHMDLTV